MDKHNYLATHRMSFALSQQELAGLLDVRNDTLSKFENGKRLINFHRALDLEAIFGQAVSVIFPDDFAERVEVVVARAAKLELAIRDKTDEESRKKKALLATIIARARPAPVL